MTRRIVLLGPLDGESRRQRERRIRAALVAFDPANHDPGDEDRS